MARLGDQPPRSAIDIPHSAAKNHLRSTAKINSFATAYSALHSSHGRQSRFLLFVMAASMGGDDGTRNRAHARSHEFDCPSQAPTATCCAVANGGNYVLD